MSEKIYRVEGMTCNHCAATVTRALESAGAGVHARVDLDAKTVTVEGLDDEAQIARIIADAGYQLVGPA